MLQAIAARRRSIGRSPTSGASSPNTGFLSRRNGRKSVSIATDTIERWDIELVWQEGWVPEAENEGEKSA